MTQCLWCEEKIEIALTFSGLFLEKAKKEYICNTCMNRLEPVSNKHDQCGTCCKPSKDKQCQDCLKWKKIYPDYDFKHRSLFYYNHFAKEYMEKYKIMGDCELALLFSSQLNNCFKSRLKDSIFIPIPISGKSLIVRGFNQVELLLENAGISYIRALENISEEEKQAKKNKKERMEMKQPFVLKNGVESQLKGKNVILVDDLYTTGRTLFHAADSLKNCFPASIKTFSLFR